MFALNKQYLIRSDFLYFKKDDNSFFALNDFFYAHINYGPAISLVSASLEKGLEVLPSKVDDLQSVQILFSKGLIYQRSHLFEPNAQPFPFSRLGVQENTNFVFYDSFPTLKEFELKNNQSYRFVYCLGESIILSPRLTKSQWNLIQRMHECIDTYSYLKRSTLPANRLLSLPRVRGTEDSLMAKLSPLDAEDFYYLDLVKNNSVKFKLPGSSTSELSVSGIFKDSEITRLNSGYRTRLENSYLEDIKNLVNPFTGPIKTLRTVQKHDAWSTVAWNAVPALSAFFPHDSGLQAFGKGSSKSAVEIGAICEFIERSTVLNGPQGRNLEWYDLEELKARQLNYFSPIDLLGFADEQYGDDCAIMDPNSLYCIPRKYKGEKIPWVSGLSLTSGGNVLIPAEFCFPLQDRIHSRNTVAFCNSEGLAAGADYCDAFLQASLELIEKDAVGIWWANRIACPVVDINVAPIRAHLLHIFSSLGLEYKIFNLSFDFPIPVYAVVSYANEMIQHITFGCHLDVEIALERAITEHHQAILLKGSPKNFKLSDFQFLSGKNHDWIHSEEFTQKKYNNFKDTNQSLLDLFKERSLEVVVVESSLVNTPIRVLRVCVPGMVSGFSRLGSKRLNSVPIKLGLRARENSFQEFHKSRIES